MELPIYCDALDTPARAAALCERLLAESASCGRPIVCAYTLPGDVLSLGRFHAVPPPPRADAGVALARRKSGGRAAPLGDGYVALACALPHRGALSREEPAAIAPWQVLNRAVRGVLGALESLGIPATYPGRDVVSVGGRVVASLGFETAADGATLVEVCLALGRSFAEVSGFADRADPGGVVPVDLVLPGDATSVAEAAGRPVTVDELVAALAAGYASRFRLDASMSEGWPWPEPDPAWLDAGRVDATLDRHAVGRDMLGVVEVYARRAADRVTAVRVCGDFIAASGSVARLEAALCGAPIDREDLRRRASDAVEGRGDVLLGVRDAATVGDLVHAACVG